MLPKHDAFAVCMGYDAHCPWVFTFGPAGFPHHRIHKRRFCLAGAKLVGIQRGFLWPVSQSAKGAFVLAGQAFGTSAWVLSLLPWGMSSFPASFDVTCCNGLMLSCMFT